MPEQVGLGVSLKASLRSREYITLLNKFGESMSNHEVLGIGAYWAEQIIERGDGYATIPTNIVFGEFAQAAFDNANYGQENASQHVTITVIYQYCRNGEYFLKSLLQRSIKSLCACAHSLQIISLLYKYTDKILTSNKQGSVR